MTQTGQELYHYGVLGMKWGVRKNPSKAYTKAVKKKEKIERRKVNLDLRSARYRSTALRKEVRARTERQYRKARKLEFRANRLSLQSARLERKGLKWIKAMDKTFAGYDIKRLSKSEMTEKGSRYIYEVLKRE